MEYCPLKFFHISRSIRKPFTVDNQLISVPCNIDVLPPIELAMHSHPYYSITYISDCHNDIRYIDGYKTERLKNKIYLCITQPIESPEVIFIGHVPTHQHIYSNGFICLSILYNEWSPALRVSSVCLSILSMLSSATKKVKPHGDAEFSAKKFTGPKQIKWFFDDDKV